MNKRNKRKHKHGKHVAGSETRGFSVKRICRTKENTITWMNKRKHNHVIEQERTHSCG